MYGLTRATTTLIAAGVAGLLIWFATQINEDHVGGFWAVYGLIAGAGLALALSQLLGGWTKWGWPRLSAPFFLLAFVPIAVVSLWIILAAEPGNGWFHRHVVSWSGDLHIRGLVNDLKEYLPLFAFGIGLVFGYCFDTTGPRRAVAPPPTATPRRRGLFGRRREVVRSNDEPAADADAPVTRERLVTDDDEVPVADRERVTTTR
jgi:hypothetical protein